MVMVSPMTHLIMQASIVEQHPADKAQFNHQFHVAVDSSPSQLRQILIKSLDREVAVLADYSPSNCLTGLGQAMASLVQCVDEVLNERMPTFLS